MQVPAIPVNESERLEELRRYKILDSGVEQDYNDLVQLASEICGTPMSLISLVDKDRQWFKANLGLADNETPRDVSFCAHAIHFDEIFIVPDATADMRFFDNPLVTNEPNIRFYAGVPLKTSGGFNLGTLCVLDSQPRELTESQKFCLKTLSRQVMHMFELKHTAARLTQQNAQLREQKAQINDLLNLRDELLMKISAQSELKSKFLSILAHDLKNPLFQLNGFVEMINEGALTADEIEKMTAQMKNGIDAVSSMLNNLLEWAWAAIDGKKALSGKVDLKKAVDTCLKEAGMLADKKGNKLINNIPEGTLVKGDRDRIELILRNLITNAIKFTEAGRITVNCVRENPLLVISVSDTGIGMDEQQLKNLLDWNKVKSTSGTRAERGTGIGLILTKEFIESMGGSLSVSSEKGVGSVFTFSLPVYIE